MTKPDRTLEILAGGRERLQAFNYLVPTVVEQTRPPPPWPWSTMLPDASTAIHAESTLTARQASSSTSELISPGSIRFGSGSS